MPKDFLSQDEVDALLRGVIGDAESEESSEQEEGSSSEARPYQLGLQERIVRGRMPTLELLNERVARFLRIGLFNFVRRNIEVSVKPVKLVKYSEFVKNVVVPTNINMVIIKPLRGTALIAIDPTLVFLFVDNMFGGDGRFHMRVEGRDFSATEMRIIQRLLSVIFEETEKAWESVYPIKFEYLRSEMNFQFSNIATPSEIVVWFGFTLEFAGLTGDINYCMPYLMIEPIRELLYSSLQSDQASYDTRWSHLLQRQLKDASVELVIPFGTADVRLADILNMSIGDVIPLEVPEKLTATVRGVPIMEGTHGTLNGHYAFKLDRVVGNLQHEMEHEQDAEVDEFFKD